MVGALQQYQFVLNLLDVCLVLSFLRFQFLHRFLLFF